VSRSGLYTIIGILVVVVVGLGGYMLYEQSQKPQLAITVDKNGLQVNGNG
jgi:hypothetical protein